MKRVVISIEQRRMIWKNAKELVRLETSLCSWLNPLRFLEFVLRSIYYSLMLSWLFIMIPAGFLLLLLFSIVGIIFRVKISSFAAKWEYVVSIPRLYPFEVWLSKKFRYTRFKRRKQLGDEIGLSTSKSVKVVLFESILEVEQPKIVNLTFEEIKKLATDITFVSHKWYGDKFDNENHDLLKRLRKKICGQPMTWSKYVWIDEYCSDGDFQEIVTAIKMIRFVRFWTHYGPGKTYYDQSLWCSLERYMCNYSGTWGNTYISADPEDVWIILAAVLTDYGSLDHECVAYLHRLIKFVEIDHPELLDALSGI